MKHIKRRLGIATAIVGTMVAASATAMATTAALSASPYDAGGVIHGCYTSTGALRLLTGSTTCGKGKPVTWVGKAIEATVQPNGTYGNSYGVTSVTHPSTGVYDLTVPAAATENCMSAATLAFSPGEISQEGNAHFIADQIQVQTYDSSGNPKDQTFSFLSVCNG